MKMGMEAVKIHNESKCKEHILIEILSDSETWGNMLHQEIFNLLNITELTLIPT